MPEIDLKSLLAAGAHFGHKTSRWSPKMAPYIYGVKNGAHIINLESTAAGLERALQKTAELSKAGQTILFVGTKKSHQNLVKTAAIAAEMPYVTERWIGGTLTNVATINRQIKKCKDLERRMASGELINRYSKLEVQHFQDEIDALNLRYGGIKELAAAPAALLITDALHDHLAVKEANILKIPVIAFVDTNVDPTPIDYVIPMNDDSLKATQLALDYFVETIQANRAATPKPTPKTSTN